MMASLTRLLLAAALAGAMDLMSSTWAGSAQSLNPPPKPKPPSEEQAQLNAWQKTLLDDSKPLPAREAALAQLAASKTGGLMLINLASQKKLPPALTEATAEVISRNSDLSVRALASQYFPRPSRSGQAFPPLAQLVKLRGDPRRGREVFLSNTASCAACHRFGREGRDIGPDLTQVSTKLDRAGLLDSVLNPSAALTFGYEPWLITLKDGETLSGFILANGENVLLKEISGEPRVIPDQEIAQRRQQLLSTMPDNIAAGLTPQELADVVEFLMQPPLLQNAEPVK